MTMVSDFEHRIRPAGQPFPDLGRGTPEEAPRVASVPRVPGRGVAAPRFTPEQTRLEIIAQSPTLIELEVDRRIRRDYDEQGWDFPQDDELAFRRTSYRDAVWRDVNLVRERDRGASVLAVGLGAGGLGLETAYRPFAAVYGFMSGATPEDSIRQAVDGLVGADPFRKQGRNIGFVRLLPDEDWFPLDISPRDIVGLGAEVIMDGIFIGRAARAVRGVATGNRLGVRPTTYVSDLPSIREYAAHVSTSRNPISRAINSAVMPDANLATEYGRIAAGARNAMIASDGLTSVALSGYDSWARRYSARTAFGRNGWLFNLSRDGEITNVVPRVEGASRAWNDVLSNPGNYDFTPQQRQFLDEVVYPLIDDADAMRVRAGLPSLKRDTSPEGWFYVPRSVTELDNIPTRGSNPAFDRTYETMAEGIAAGVRYDHDLRAVLQAHVRGSYQAVVNKQLNEALEAVEIAAARVREGIARVRTPAAREALKEGRTVRRQFRDAIAEIERQAATPDIDPATRDAMKAAEQRLRRAEMELTRQEFRAGQSGAAQAAAQAAPAPGSTLSLTDPARYAAMTDQEIDAILNRGTGFHALGANDVEERLALRHATARRLSDADLASAIRNEPDPDRLAHLAAEQARRSGPEPSTDLLPTAAQVTRWTDEGWVQTSEGSWVFGDSAHEGILRELDDALAENQRALDAATDPAARDTLLGNREVLIERRLNEVANPDPGVARRAADEIPPSAPTADPVAAARAEFDEATAAVNALIGQPASAVSEEAVERAAALGQRAAGLAEEAAKTERIAVDSWRGRWFPTEIADELNQVLPALTDDSNIFGRSFEAIGDTIRTNSAIFDVGVSLLHGIPMLFNDPRAWSRATGASVFSLLDPTTTSRYMRDHIDTFQRMAKAGVPVGDNEIFAALRQGRATNLFGLIQQVTERLPGLSDSTSDELTRVLNTMKSQSYGRFNASYDAFLAVGRSMMWEGLEGNIRDPQVLARHLRNMTGGLDSRALGVSRNRRGFESTWLAFAPRYTRSVGALLAEMFDSDPAIRRAAQEAVAKTVGGVATLYVATGAFMGKPVEEIMEGLDPTSGKRFLSHEINGDWVGLGGGMRSIFQMIGGSIALGAEVVTDPSRLLDMDLGNVFSSRDNPLLTYVESRGAPGQTLLRAAIEAFSGGEYNALPYNEVYNSIDLLKHVGKSSLPFALQGIIEGEQIGTVGAAFGGLRTSAQTPRERSAAVVDRALMRAGLSDFETLAEAEGDSYAGQIARGTLTPEERAEVDRIEADRIDALRQANLVRNDPMAKGLLASVDAYERVTQFITENPTDLRAIREFASQQMEAARAIREEPGVAAALARLPEAQTEIGRDIERYYSLFDIEDPVERDEQEAAFRRNIGEARYARVVNNVFAVTRPMPEQWQQIQQGKKVLTETGFFDLGDPAWEMVQQRAAEAGLDDPSISNATSYSEWYEGEVDRREALLVVQGWKPEEARQRARNEATRIDVATAFGDALTLQRLAWVQANPEGARSAYALGYLNAGDRNTISAGVLPAAPEASGPSPVTSVDLAREHEEGASYDDLARKYGLTAEAVRSRIRRATGR